MTNEATESPDEPAQAEAPAKAPAAARVTSTPPRTAPKAPGANKPGFKGDGGVAQAAAKMDAETDAGYSGTVPDPTPNHAYSVAGVTAGEPTPETDQGAYDAAQAAHREIAGAQRGG